jgi:8-amino-7-oxononanoate synthase
VKGRFAGHPHYVDLRKRLDFAREHGLRVPFSRVSEGARGGTITIDGREYLNFANYDYLDLASHPAVVQAAKDALDCYGTTVSASRLVSGERSIHRELESELAAFIGTEDCLVFVSGYLANLTTIGHLYDRRDLVAHDSLAHNSLVHGCLHSGARRLSFPHNDWAALDKLLSEHRGDHKRALIVLEGLYSMDGDCPDLPRFLELRQRHDAHLMVDEAHSLGVLGRSGRGLGEHFAIAADEVDIWMGTLSKALASCGGYIAGSKELIECLRLSAPGFVFSVGLPPASAAAALAGIRVLKAEPWRVSALRSNGRSFLDLAVARGLDTGLSQGCNVVPVITESSELALRLSDALLADGISVYPVIPPAVREETARLRFFLSCAHTEEQIRRAVDLTAGHWNRVGGGS